MTTDLALDALETATWAAAGQGVTDLASFSPRCDGLVLEMKAHA